MSASWTEKRSSAFLEVLRETDGSRTRTAEILGLDRKTLYRKLQDYEQEVPPETPHGADGGLAPGRRARAVAPSALTGR